MRQNTPVFLALASLASAQTFSACDPTKGDKCPPNPAFGNCGKPTVFDLSTVPHGADVWKKDKGFLDFWAPEKGILGDKSPLSIGDDGAILTITNKDQAPLIKTNKYLFYGRVEVETKAAPGVGIVTSIVLESDDRDEIDWEWIGGEQTNVQTNFFSKGANEFVNGITHAVSFNAMEGLHKYAIDWTPERIVFSVDGAEIRRATPKDFNKWPQTPVQVKLGTWVGGKTDLPQGTIDWAGGLADFAQAPFVAAYKSISITDYCGGKDKAGSYSYSDASGSQDSIVISDAGADVGFGGDDDGEDTSSAKPTKTKSDEKTTAKPTASSTSSADDSASSGDASESGSGGDAEPTGGADAGADQGDDGSAASVAGMSSTLAAAAALGWLLFA
ncbi:related to cell wall protein (putative glycosidase) [Cephalotrichum gorgonifer]|uniref:Related to cell wall protein (Putative glycosidase) n=1 Tax=Cephalotrichum gorgonifer TaxID=2041049 RepID=A0AAE8SUJ8_9PEZI|nr:related to cell wall protein (putative glycosidase) [Cephalotrichum gorgonifer]